MQKPRETQGGKELIVLNKGVQMGHVPGALIPKNLSQMRLTEDV